MKKMSVKSKENNARPLIDTDGVLCFVHFGVLRSPMISKGSHFELRHSVRTFDGSAAHHRQCRLLEGSVKLTWTIWRCAFQEISRAMDSVNKLQ